MPLPKRLARFNRTVTNRVTLGVAGWLPGFAIIEHRGRRSGREFRTPVNAFRRGDMLSIALTYGTTSDWIKNVHAADGCRATSSGERLTLAAPLLVHDERRCAVPVPVRLVLRLLGVADFLELTIVTAVEH